MHIVIGTLALIYFIWAIRECTKEDTYTITVDIENNKID